MRAYNLHIMGVEKQEQLGTTKFFGTWLYNVNVHIFQLSGFCCFWCLDVLLQENFHLLSPQNNPDYLSGHYH